MKTLVVVGFLALIVYNLGAALYYMLTDRGESKRTVNAHERIRNALTGRVLAGDRNTRGFELRSSSRRHGANAGHVTLTVG